MIKFPDQFINWKEVSQLPPKKPAKVPCDSNGNKINPLDPSNWLSHEQALKNNYPIGFVLSGNDPYFLLDLDDILLPSGEWDSWSQMICASFPGAAIEVSHSGNGIHIMGRCDASKLTDRRNKFADNKAEFYHKDRFVAFGQGLTGNLDIDWTDTLLSIVPQRNVDDMAQVDTSGPVSDWTGPTDDETLIQKALGSAGSIAAQFGDKASFSDLWNANKEKLSKVFPSQSGDNFDRSSADAALMAHLAFWTGKDYSRMDRLFRKSALMRDKFTKRSDYRHSTITGAIRKTSKVYCSKPTNEPDPEATERAIASGALLTIQEQMIHFANCVYVSGLKKIMTPNGSFLDSGQFRAFYGGREFMYKTQLSSGPKVTDNAFLAFTENHIQAFPMANGVTFRADQPYQAINSDIFGVSSVNVYRAINPKSIEGDASPFLNLIRKLLPDENDAEILISYMAAVAQYPGKKFLWAPVVIGTQGNGKSTLINILQYVIDGVRKSINDDETRYTLSMTAKHIDDKFNGDMFQKTLVVVHEMHSSGLDFKKEMIRQDYLKQLITEESITIEKKGVDKFNARNVANFFFCSNHKDAIRLESSERRFAVLYTAQQNESDIQLSGMGSGYFETLWNWLKTENGFEICNHYLKSYQIPVELDPTKGAQKAPKTTATEAAVWESRPYAEQMVISALNSGDKGFRNGWVSTKALRTWFENEGEKAPYGKSVTRILNNLGYVGGFRATRSFTEEDATLQNSRTRLYVNETRLHELNSDGKGWTDDFARDQGYVEFSGVRF